MNMTIAAPIVCSNLALRTENRIIIWLPYIQEPSPLGFYNLQLISISGLLRLLQRYGQLAQHLAADNPEQSQHPRPLLLHAASITPHLL